MLKILVGLVFTSTLFASAPLTLGADIAAQKGANVTLKKVKIGSQQISVSSRKSINSQTDRISNEARIKPIKTIADPELTSTKAQFGLLLTALFCFVALSNRRGV